MANKRQLKKHIRYVCGDMAAEILCARACYDGFDSDKVAQIVGEIATLQVDTLKKITFSVDKGQSAYADAREYNKARRAYNKAAFRKLKEEFKAGVLKVVKDMNAAMPEEVKEQTKRG